MPHPAADSPHFVEADVLIVGGGSTGAVLAARLSESTDRRVLLVEAGPDTPPDAVPGDIADAFPRSYSNPDYMWPGLEARHRAGDMARPYTQARVMGGGSSLMGMWALRGLAADYDSWEAAGARGWAWKDVLPCFEKLESDSRHGTRGPVTLRRVDEARFAPHVRALQHAAAALGYPTRPDINETEADGFFQIPLSQSQGARVSSASAYLTAEVRRRPNLRILCDTEVTKLAFDGRRVIGVWTSSRSQNPVFRGAHEVIVCAGAVHSPALLLRSGIGPAADLLNAGVTVVADRPGVGRNLQNHVCVNLGLTLPRTARQIDPADRDYGVACLRASSGLAGGSTADLLLGVIGRTSMRAIGTRVSLLTAFLYDPRSRGSVGLVRDGDALRTRIDFNLLSDPADLARMTHGLRLALRLLRSPTCAQAWSECMLLPPTAPLHRLNRPGAWAAVQAVAALAAFNAGSIARQAVLARVIGRSAFLDPRHKLPDLSELAPLCLLNATPMFHVAGSCAMGDVAAAGSVVDADCRVIGVTGLRVADASIMPKVPRANTNLPALMIGERLAQRMDSKSKRYAEEGVAV